MPLNAFIRFLPDGDKNAVIHARDMNGGLVELETKQSYDKCQKGLWQYNEGHPIQVAFPFLSPDEREFMMTGMHGEEYDSLFPEEE